MPPVKDRLSKTKYDQFQVEEEVKKLWREMGLQKRLNYRPGAGRKFYFLDGPPYASAQSIHPGTAWNKVIKDVVLRYKRMQGYNVWSQPGYDTHGLPIEVKVEQMLGVKTKKEIEERIGVERFIEECRRFAAENIKAMNRQFEEIGASMDWENPYITYKNEYIESGWWLIKQAWEKGLLEQDYRVVHWCPRCETTLADYEVSEYRELEDPSIYVKFPLRERPGESLLIWTTTPWTLPANTFVMAHPELTYVRVRVGEEVLILAKERLEPVMREAGVEDYEVLEELPGERLEGLTYNNPLDDVVDAQKRVLAQHHRVVMAPEAVTAHEGTGLVHAAPGHGDVDYEVAKRLGIPVVSLVDDQGRMTRDAGVFAGLYFRGEANARVLEVLRGKGALFHEARVVHRYPVCWRCKTPLLLRATGQWVIRVTRLKTKLLSEAQRVNWRPEWAKTRFENMLRNLRDWVISRQRYWGIPLPLWRCRDCGHVIAVGSVDELEKHGGQRPPDLHRPWVDRVELKCPKCGGTMRRVPDVLDVWFDSGVSFYASLGYPREKRMWEELRPVDFIVEGHDQIRGWFFSLMRSGVIGFEQTPYLTVLVHGFMLDEHGQEMHKSLGNYVEFEELITRYPRDVVRFWFLQNTVWEDLRFSFKGLEQMRRDFTVFWNVHSFASTYMSLDGYDPRETPLESVAGSLQDEDRWILSRLSTVLREYREVMDRYELHRAARLLRSFMVEDVSHWYIKLIRRRVWSEEQTPEKTAAYAVLYRVLWDWLRAMAPFTPFLAEYLYQNLFREAGGHGEESIHLHRLPTVVEEWIDPQLEQDMERARELIEAVAALRMKANINVRRPLSRLLLAPASEDVRRSLERLAPTIKAMANVKELAFVDEKDIKGQQKARAKPKMGALGPAFKKLAPRVASHVEEHSEEVAQAILEKGSYTLSLEGQELTLDKSYVEIEIQDPSWMRSASTPLGLLAIDLRLPQELVEEGLARELVRRIQYMRKEAKLDVEDNITLWLTGDPQLLRASQTHEDYIKQETRATTINRETTPPEDALCREWSIDDKKVTICLKKQ